MTRAQRLGLNTIAVLLLATGALALTVPGCERQPAAAASARVDDSIYARVIRSGVIRAGYVPYPPAFIIDPNSKKVSGIFAETLEKAASNLGLRVEWVSELNWQTQVEETKLSTRIDLLGSSSWANSARAKHVDFLTPLYFSGLCAYVRANDHRFDGDIALLNAPSTRISLIDGDTSDFIAKSRFPKAQIVSLPQSSEYGSMIQNVADGKADVTFIEPYAASVFLQAHPGSIRNLTPDQPIVVYPNCMMVKKGQVELESTLNTAIDELVNSGFVDELIRKYVPEKGSVFPVARPYRVDDMKR